MRNPFLISLVLLMLFAVAYLQPPFLFGEPEAAYSLNEKLRINKNGKIIFVSDTQEPIWAETIFLSANRNAEARDSVFSAIIREHPAAVFHLGDMISYGYKNRCWNALDNFVQNLARDSVPFYPTLGNHEYLFFANAGKKNFEKRFPFAKETGYAVRAGNLYVILLNSNFSELTDNQIGQQQKFYENALATATRDTTIKGVIVATHYSLFTNSKIVSPSAETRKRFLPGFYRLEKPALFLSGHAHAFEHFYINGKNFLVIGGGGGLQQPLYVGKEEKYKDLYDSTHSKRMFHFIEAEWKNNALKVTLKMLRKDFSGFSENYVLKIANSSVK